MEDTKLVFVYGSLRGGNRLGSVMSLADNFLGEFKTKPKYTMYSLNVFPAITKSGNTRIVGEVYEINQSLESRLDMIEGVPNFYYKDSIEIEGLNKPVYAYFMKAEKVKGLQIKDDGDWLL